jgi:AraC family transcriptional regulator
MARTIRLTSIVSCLCPPSLPARDPLLQHLALVLQAAIEGEGVAGQLYAESLIDALVVHFLKRYAAAWPSRQEVTGGLSPYKLALI